MRAIPRGIQLGGDGSQALLEASLNGTKAKGPAGSTSVERQERCEWAEGKFRASSVGLQTPGGGRDLSSGLDFRKTDPLGASDCKVSTVH